MNSLNAVPIRQIYERWVAGTKSCGGQLLRLQEDVQAGRGVKHGLQDQPKDK